MVKKLKKYVKFVVCCALMLSLMAPSYAALSASDGSAFVTKAEFDSALADFNARFTTFEAGINSKIDSQVTSYLDRNGIWSGKEQENYKSKEYTVSAMHTEFSTKYVWDYLINTQTIPPYSFFDSIMFTATKSGLAYTVFNWNVDWCLHYSTVDGNHKLSQGNFFDESYIYADGDKNNVITAVKIWNTWLSIQPGGWAPVLIIGGFKASVPILYFVEKEHVYSFNCALHWGGRYNTSSTNTGLAAPAWYGSHYNNIGYTDTKYPADDTSNKLYIEGTTKVY